MPEAEEILLREYEHAWLHNRHLEGLRSQYLGFFLTFLATAVVLGTPHYLDALNSPRGAAQVSVALIGASLVTWFVSTSLKRWGAVIRHYDGVIGAIREASLNDDQLRMVWIRPVRGVGVQHAAEFALLVAHVSLCAAAGTLLAHTIEVGTPLGYVSAAAAVLATVVGLVTGVDKKLPREIWRAETAPRGTVPTQKGG